MRKEMSSSSVFSSASRYQSAEGGTQSADVEALLANISCTSFPPPPASASTAAAQDAPSPCAPLAAEEDESTPRDYDLPVRSRIEITNDCKCGDNDKYEKVEGGGRVDCPPTPGVLDQTITLKSSVVGRTKHPHRSMCHTIHPNRPY